MQDMRSNQRGCRAGGRGHSRRSSVHVSIRLRVLSRQARAQFPSAFFSAATSFSRLSTCRTSASFRARSRVSSFSMLSLTLRTAARRSERGSPPPPPGPCRQEVTEQGHPRQQGMAAVGRAIGRTADGTSTRHHAACTSSTLPPTRRRPRSTPIWRLQPCGRTHRRAPAACRGPGASMHRWRTKDCAVGSVARAQQQACACAPAQERSHAMTNDDNPSRGFCPAREKASKMSSFARDAETTRRSTPRRTWAPRAGPARRGGRAARADRTNSRGR